MEVGKYQIGRYHGIIKKTYETALLTMRRAFRVEQTWPRVITACACVSGKW